MTSNRKRKKQAESLGLTPRELELAELLAEVLDNLRWMQILAYSNQYLVNDKLEVDKAERDRILEAATRAVEKDHKIHEWQDRLARLKSEIQDLQRRIGEELPERRVGEERLERRVGEDRPGPVGQERPGPVGDVGSGAGGAEASGEA